MSETNPRRIDRLAFAGLAGLLSTALITFAVSGVKGPVVIGETVIRRWYVVGAVLVLSLIALVASVVVRDFHESSPGWRPVAPPRSMLRRIGKGLFVVVCLLVGGLAFLVTVVMDSSMTYTVLPERSANGCRVVVGEHSFLLLGSGSVYLLPAGQHRPREVNTYFADDGYMPIHEKAYRIVWQGEVADLSIWGTAVIRCPTTTSCCPATTNSASAHPVLADEVAVHAESIRRPSGSRWPSARNRPV